MINGLKNFWNTLIGKDPQKRAAAELHSDLERALGEHRQSMQKLESVARLAVRKLDKRNEHRGHHERH